MTSSLLYECSPEDGQTMKTISLIQFLRIGVLFYEWLDIPALKKYYAFGFDHYNLSWHKAGMSGLRDTMLGRSGPFAAGNWVLPDLSIQHAVEVNKKLQTYPNTYYFRYMVQIFQRVLNPECPLHMDCCIFECLKGVADFAASICRFKATSTLCVACLDLQLCNKTYKESVLSDIAQKFSWHTSIALSSCTANLSLAAPFTSTSSL
jgi:hypothetical protein